jgi:hypothetical protein
MILYYNNITQTNMTAIYQEPSRELTHTENNALSHISSGQFLVDAFYKLIRNCPEDYTSFLIENAWLDDPKITIQIMMQLRDCRGGKGEKRLAKYALYWLRRNKPNTYVKNLQEFINYGCYKDLLDIVEICKYSWEWFDAPRKTNQDREALNLLKKDNQEPLLGKNTYIELEMLADQLRKDNFVITEYLKVAPLEDESKEVTLVTLLDKLSQNIKQENNQDIHISLAGKWAPSEQGAYHNLAFKMAKLLFPNDNKKMKSYRKLLSNLRKFLDIVERRMCSKEWQKIIFSKVPSKAHHILKNSFKKHQPERYAKYLTDLEEGKTKINTTGLQASDPIKGYINDGNLDRTSENQIKTMINKIKESGSFENTVSLVDVSSSMEGQPLETAVALGLFVSEITKPPFGGRIITFETNPRWCIVTGNDYYEKVQSMKKAPWGGSTDVTAAFRLILNCALEHKLTQDKMPTKLFIFSDMQFNTANKNNNMTTYQQVKQEYTNAGYTIPKIVFWNLRGDTKGVPVTVDENGTCMISGYSADLLKLFLEGDELNTQTIMKKALSKYTKIIIDEKEI